MKSLLKPIILAGFLLFGFNSFSQLFDFNDLENQAGSASLTTDYCLTLDNSSPLTEFYLVQDISSFGFASEKEAQNEFGKNSNNLVTYIVDYPNNRVFVWIHDDRTPDGTATGSVSWWNNYLNGLCNQ